MRRFQERSEALLTWHGDQVADIDRDVPHNRAAFSYLDAPAEPLAADPELVRYLHWMRHRESIGATRQRDAEGDMSAIDALARTAKDFRRIVHGQGPLKPFQGDTIHRQLLEILFCYEVEPLTAEERADCFDKYRACGKTHDADALKKQYARLKKDWAWDNFGVG